jgi:hypothetical protein
LLVARDTERERAAGTRTAAAARVTAAETELANAKAALPVAEKTAAEHDGLAEAADHSLAGERAAAERNRTLGDELVQIVRDHRREAIELRKAHAAEQRRAAEANVAEYLRVVTEADADVEAVRSTHAEKVKATADALAAAQAAHDAAKKAAFSAVVDARDAAAEKVAGVETVHFTAVHNLQNRHLAAQRDHKASLKVRLAAAEASATPAAPSAEGKSVA